MIKFWSYEREYVKYKKSIFANIKKSINSGNIFFGDQLKIFEKNFTKRYKAKYGIAVGSGTDALLISLTTLSLKPGDEIITAANTFVATVGAICELGATPVFVDCNDTFCIDTSLIEAKITEKTKAFLPVHYTGYMTDMRVMNQISEKYNIPVIEDACQSILGAIDAKNAGTWGKAGAFSLHPLKSITSGEGGIVCTNNSLLAKNIKTIRSHGIQKNKKDEHWVYDISEPGYNFRISEMNCALALSQLGKLDSFINLRKKISSQYINFFKSFEYLLKVRPYNLADQNAWHLFVILVDFKKFKISKNDFFKHLLKRGIICQQHYKPLYEFSYYSHINRKNFINSSAYINSAISIPIYFELKKSKIKYICQIIKNFLTQNIIKDGI